MSTDFQEMMRRARADAEEGDWSPGPGGHEAIVDSGDAFTANAGHVVAKATLRLVKPGSDDDGKTWDHIMSFKSDKSASMSASQLALYGLSAEQMDNLTDVEDLAAAMADLEGTHVTVTCKAQDEGDGVWTNITGSRTRKSDIPTEQSAFSLGDERKSTANAGPYDTGTDDDPIPF